MGWQRAPVIGEHQAKVKRAELVLGSVQLGMPYGAANRSGMPSEADAVALIRNTISRGVRQIDTARAYGDAERRIGIALAGADSTATVVTKLDPMISLHRNARHAVATASESIEASRTALRRECLPVLLLHRAEHRLLWDGAVWQFLRDEQRRGRVGRLGISVQSPAEALAALSDPTVEHIQLPFNLLDHRWSDAGVIAALRRRPEVTVHARSVLLQGLLTADPLARWPLIDGISPGDLKATLFELAARFERSDVTDLAIAYVRAQDWIDGIVIGMETKEQLSSNLASFERPPLAIEGCNVIERLPRLTETLLDPSLWPRPAPLAAPGSQ
jgi:spore coat polysaccharide biosynthesis protein SpsF